MADAAGSACPATARLFVAIAPSPHLVTQLTRLARPQADWIRWTSPEQWHVTLRFFGSTELSQLPALVAALRAAARDPVTTGVARCTPRAGPTVERLGQQVLCVPVVGLERMAAGVEQATAGLGEPPVRRAYRGHLTLARARAKRQFHEADAGTSITATWEVTDLDVWRSHLDPGGARYERLARIALA